MPVYNHGGKGRAASRQSAGVVVTVAEIAERAGLTKRTFFRHLADKREVLFLGEDVLSRLTADAIADAPSPPRRWPQSPRRWKPPQRRSRRSGVVSRYSARP